jgi:hypothetical protein
MQIQIKQHPCHIAFSGTHGTGKRTAVIKLHSKADKYEPSYTDGVIRQCAQFFPISQKMTLQSQQYIFASFIKQYHFDSFNHLCLHARSIWDCIAYTECLAERYRKETLARQEADKTAIGMAMIAKYIHYDYILVLHPDNNYNRQDGARDTDKRFRLKVHDKLIEILQRNNIEHTVIPDINQWFDELQIIERR